jgi:uncharacterized repeat protein (TIGR02543 family)
MLKNENNSNNSCSDGQPKRNLKPQLTLSRYPYTVNHAKRPAQKAVISASPTPRVVVNNVTELQNAVNAAVSGVETVIEIGTSFNMTASVTIPSGKNIVLTSSGDTKTLTRAPGFTDRFIIIYNSADLTLRNIVLDGNKANVTATDPLIEVYRGTLTIEDGAVLENNTSSGYGGGIYVENGSYTQTGGAVSGNSAPQGGGIYMVNGPLTLEGGIIADNTATSFGGAIYMDSGPLIMEDGLIARNTSGSNGGGIFLANNASATLVMNGGMIAENVAINGGGVFAAETSSFTMNAGVITGNVAGSGGGVYINTDATFVMLGDSEISGNHAVNPGGNGYGGGVDSVGSFTQIGGRITGNDAQNFGGGLYVQGIYTLEGGVISGNTSTNGGGIMTVMATVNITNAVITDNVAANRGGGLYGISSGSVTIVDSVVAGNVADKGGGFYMMSPVTLNISGASMLIADNSATSAEACPSGGGDAAGTGGGIYSNPRTLTTIGPEVIFTRNYAAHAYNMPLGADQSAYDSVVHGPSLDPQYDVAWNNADVNYCPLTDPTMQITYHRNNYAGDPITMILGSNLTEDDDIPGVPPPWTNGTLNFAGWSLIPNDTCPTLSQPMPKTYHAADFSADDPRNLDVYAIWCPESIYHEVKFDANGGTPVPSQSVRDGDLATFASSTRADCIFDGWYTNKNLDVRFNFNTPIYEDLTLHAKWICSDAALTPDKLAELAELESLLAALEQGEKCYNIGILTEYGYRLVEHNGTLYLHSQLTTQSYLAVVPITIAEVVTEIDELEKGM